MYTYIIHPTGWTSQDLADLAFHFYNNDVQYTGEVVPQLLNGRIVVAYTSDKRESDAVLTALDKHGYIHTPLLRTAIKEIINAD